MMCCAGTFMPSPEHLWRIVSWPRVTIYAAGRPLRHAASSGSFRRRASSGMTPNSATMARRGRSPACARGMGPGYFRAAARGGADHGDADLVPLASRLRTRDVHVVVPVVDTEFAGDGERRVLRTAPRLVEAASTAPPLTDLMAAGLMSGWPPHCPFSAPVRVSQQPAAASGRRRGIITRWDSGETSGFITEAVTGASCFVSRDDLPAGARALTPGTSVTFTGSPRPRPQGSGAFRAYPGLVRCACYRAKPGGW
jgi:cold shock CspA family protein